MIYNILLFIQKEKKEWNLSFEPPTEYFNEQIAGTEENICKLMKQLKELSNDNPGLPTTKYITE